MALTASFTTGQQVPFQRVRHLLDQSALQEGVVQAGDFKVAQRAAGANMSVDVAAGGCWVKVDTGTRNGLVHVVNDGVANVTVPAANATNPRVDQVVVQYNDTTIPAGVGGDTPTLRLITGTATAGATLDNRSGAAALPSDALRLADVLVPAGATSVTTANIRDRRPWARGAYSIKSVNADISTASTSPVEIHSTLQARIEASGVPLRVALEAGSMNNNNTGAATFISLYLNGVESAQRKANTPAVSYELPTPPAFEFLPTPGSLLIQMFWKVSAGTSNLLRLITAGNVRLVVQESVRPNAAND